MRSCWGLLGILFALWATDPGATEILGESSARAKKAFESGDFTTALAHYLALRKHGNDTPSITYNIAVSYYRNHDLDAARTEFRSLLADEVLGPLAEYNLGLVESARGNIGAAARHFKRVRIRTDNEQLLKLANTALSSFTEPEKHPKARFDIRTTGHVGLAYDSNVYRSPKRGYTDFARTSAPAVSPDIQPGFFLPLSLRTRFIHAPESDASWILDYKFDSRVYTDAALDNANRFKNKLRIGHANTLMQSDEMTQQFYVGAVFRLQSRQDVDRDDGVDREFSGTDISDRVSYFSDGFEARYLLDFERSRVWFNANIERRNYKHSNTVPEYDHMIYALGAALRYRFSSTDRLLLRYGFSKRDYDQRRARDLFGDILSQNAHREYHDQAINLLYSHRFSRMLRAKIRYRAIHRDDRFVGYDDYLEHNLWFKVNVRPHRRVRVMFDAAYTHRDYPRAFAFNNPLQKDKSKDIYALNASAQYQLSRHWLLVGSISYRDERTPDTRFAYDRTISSLGLQFEF